MIVTDDRQIKNLQEKMKRTILKNTYEKIYATVGFHGGSHSDYVYWFEELGFWYLPLSLDNRFWNAFGLEKPTIGANLAITCEINFPFGGTNRRISGAFVKDESSVFVVHRGRIGGSIKGGGRSLFLENYTGEWQEVDDDGINTKVALVASLSSEMFVYQIKEYIKQIQRIKALLRGCSIEEDDFDNDYSEEFFGTKAYKTNRHVEAKCNHGLIVSHLAEVLLEKGYRVLNDIHKDLYIQSGNKRATFEVKTDSNLDSLYSGVGQLLLNCDGRKNCNLILVLPQQPALKYIDRINKTGIRIVTYKWDNQKYHFNFRQCPIL